MTWLFEPIKAGPTFRVNLETWMQHVGFSPLLGRVLQLLFHKWGSTATLDGLWMMVKCLGHWWWIFLNHCPVSHIVMRWPCLFLLVAKAKHVRSFYFLVALIFLVKYHLCFHWCLCPLNAPAIWQNKGQRPTGINISLTCWSFLRNGLCHSYFSPATIGRDCRKEELKQVYWVSWKEQISWTSSSIPTEVAG